MINLEGSKELEAGGGYYKVGNTVLILYNVVCNDLICVLRQASLKTLIIELPTLWEVSFSESYY